MKKAVILCFLMIFILMVSSCTEQENITIGETTFTTLEESTTTTEPINEDELYQSFLNAESDGIVSEMKFERLDHKLRKISAKTKLHELINLFGKLPKAEKNGDEITSYYYIGDYTVIFSDYPIKTVDLELEDGVVQKYYHAAN